jgi:UDP-GlcNAc:undecaprenyl-phosphate GlcNAc-1-phosphate transferase
MRLKFSFKKSKIKNLTSNFFIKRDPVAFYLLLFSFGIGLFSFVILSYFYLSLPQQIPLWFSLPWGVYRLAIREYILLIPVASLGLTFLSAFFVNSYLRHNIREVARFIATSTVLASVAFLFSGLSIVYKTVLKNFYLSPWVLDYLVPVLLAFFITKIAVRVVIQYADKLKIIEYPSIRNEPGKVLTKPTPRGGAIAFWLGFATTTSIFLWYSQRAWGLIIGTFITTLVGYLDDRYKLNFLPRLVFLLPLAFIVVILSGFVMFYIPNPFGDPIMLDKFRYTFEFLGDTRSVVLIGSAISFVWFMWMANMISWNNGTDGQFVAITLPLALAIAVLSLRFTDLSYEQKLSAQLAFITAGALLGMFKDTFPPNKIIWGFGATGVGLILAALSITSGTRVATAILVLLVPSIDVAYVIYSRVKQKKSPFHGDRNHLHHKLLDLGWSKRNVAIFYWLVSIIFACLALMLSGKSKLLMLVTASGLILYAAVVIRRYAGKFHK